MHSWHILKIRFRRKTRRNSLALGSEIRATLFLKIAENNLIALLNLNGLSWTFCESETFGGKTWGVKGQLVSEGNFGFLKSPKKWTFFLASKMGEINKIKAPGLLY